MTQTLDGPAAAQRRMQVWVRFWARAFDYSLLLYLAAAIVAGSSAPVSHDWFQALAFPALTATWTMAEAFLLWNFGTTPGKALLRIAVEPSGRNTMPWNVALGRSAEVWGRGIALGLHPLLTAIGCWEGDRRYTRGYDLHWDAQWGTTLRYGAISWHRWLVLYVIVAVPLILPILSVLSLPLLVAGLPPVPDLLP